MKVKVKKLLAYALIALALGLLAYYLLGKPKKDVSPVNSIGVALWNGCHTLTIYGELNEPLKSVAGQITVNDDKPVTLMNLGYKIFGQLGKSFWSGGHDYALKPGDKVTIDATLVGASGEQQSVKEMFTIPACKAGQVLVVAGNDPRKSSLW